MADQLRERLQLGERAVGNWISIGHPAVAEVCAHGFDFLIIDSEHTSMGLESLENAIRAVEAVEDNVAPLVRVAWNDPVRIKRVLDLGVAGLMIPMVETGDQAQQAVDAMRYPPEGIRGAAPARASNYGRTFNEYFEAANDELLTIVQIETELGAENVEEIAAVDGVDAVIVGQGDLSASLGIFGEWENNRFQSTLSSILKTVHEAGKPVGMLAMDAEEIHRWVDAGVDFVIAGVDVAYLAKGSIAARKEFEATVADAEGDAS